MAHTHSPKSTRSILGNELYECACGARKWSHGYEIDGAVLDVDGWYVAAETKEEIARRDAVETLQTEGYGYDWNKQDVNDPLDSHHPDFQD